ncbi:MAG: PAS domain-containing protein [Rhodospirillales bacterium]|nr:PAS domain-containing protein [Rhodospirillales bacterium]
MTERWALALLVAVMAVFAIAAGAAALGMLYAFEHMQSPFIDSAGIAALVGIPLILTGSCVFFFVSRSILRRNRQSQKRFRDLVENMRSGVCILKATPNGDDFLITDFNRAAEHIQGRDRSELIGQPLSKAMPEVGSSGLSNVLRRVWRTGAPEHVPAANYTAPTKGTTAVWQELFLYRLATGEIVMVSEE